MAPAERYILVSLGAARQVMAPRKVASGRLKRSPMAQFLPWSHHFRVRLIIFEIVLGIVLLSFYLFRD